MSRGFRYVTSDRLNRQRGKLILKPAVAVFGQSWRDGTWNQPKPAPALVIPFPAAPITPAPVDPVTELARAEATMRDVVRVYDIARREIADANRTHTPVITANGAVLIPAKSFTAERRRERRAAAFRLFNKRRAQLLAARRRLDAAGTVLRLGVYAASAHCRPELGASSNSWPKPDPSAPL